MSRKKGDVTKTFTFQGKRYYVTGKTEREAIEKCVLKKREMEEGRYLISDNPLLKHWAELCMETYVMPKVKDKTFKNYMDIVNIYILNDLGDYQIKQIKAAQIQRVVNKLTGKSNHVIKQTTRFLKLFFKRAVIEKMIPEDPTLDLVKPKGTSKTRRALTEEENEVFLRVINNPAFGDRFLVFMIMYYCGCRPEEARNCESSDISFKDGYPILHVRGTKRDASDRNVPIPPQLYERIKDRKGFLATNEAGKKFTEQAFDRAWDRLEREMNIEMGCKVYRNALVPPFPLAEDLVPYCLRHTYCTNLQKQKIDIRIAQYLMGHKDIRMTANIYTHADDSFVISAAEVMNAVK